MDQKKIGIFFKELRKEKNITQEKLAEIMNVSRRTVSRWETGSNMPDLDILIEMADFYEVDIRELLDGERRNETMDQEMKKTVLKAADYDNEERLKITQRIHIWFIVALICALVYFASLFLEPAAPNVLFDFAQGLLLGFVFAMIFIGVLMTGKDAKKLRNTKRRLLKKSNV